MMRLGVIFISVIALLMALPFLGAENLTLSEALNPSSVSHRILFELRVPRLLLLFFVGGILAMLGGTYQTLFHNPLAEPYVLGISSAVTLGAVVGEVFFHVPPHSLQGIGICFAASLLATLSILLLAVSHFGREPERIILFGMGLNFFLSSALFLLLSYYSHQMGGGSLRWLFGQIPWVSMKEVAYFGAVAVFLGGILWIYARHLDALSMGDTVARTLGISPVWSRNLFLLLTSLLVTLVVSQTGSIGFVGLIVPHAVRLVFRPASSRAFLSRSFLFGSLFLAVADVGSRVLLPPFEFPIGVITTLIGAPPFLFLLWRR